MTLSVRSVATIATLALFAEVATTCGGKVVTGSFDVDGGFHALDGAFLFGPGSSCVDYDAAGIVGEWQGASETTISCTNDQACVGALPKGLSFNQPPTGQFYYEGCQTDVCTATVGANVACNGTDDDSNRYCQTFYQQFVAAPGAIAQATCQPCQAVELPPHNACPSAYVCAPTCCERGGFCVQRGNAAPTCEFPCQP